MGSDINRNISLYVVNFTTEPQHLHYHQLPGESWFPKGGSFPTTVMLTLKSWGESFLAHGFPADTWELKPIVTLLTKHISITKYRFLITTFSFCLEISNVYSLRSKICAIYRRARSETITNFNRIYTPTRGFAPISAKSPMWAYSPLFIRADGNCLFANILLRPPVRPCSSLSKALSSQAVSLEQYCLFE